MTLPPRISGFTCIVQRGDGKRGLPVVVVNDRHSLERRRLTLAHELAHRVIEAASSASAIGALAEDLISLIKAAGCYGVPSPRSRVTLR